LKTCNHSHRCIGMSGPDSRSLRPPRLCNLEQRHSIPGGGFAASRSRSQCRRPSPRLTAGAITPFVLLLSAASAPQNAPAPDDRRSTPVSPATLGRWRALLLLGTARGPLAVEEGDAAPSATDDGDAGVLGRQPGACKHHLPCLRLRLLPPLLGTQGTPFFVLLGLPIAKS
jgi:hypothetical protein